VGCGHRPPHLSAFCGDDLLHKTKVQENRGRPAAALTGRRTGERVSEAGFAGGLLMAFRGPFEDQSLIRNRVGAYSDATFRADAEAWLACFTDDAVRSQNGSEVRGKPALRAMWDEVWGFLEKMALFAEIGAIEIDGDRARARCYCREILFLKGGGLRKVVGIYDDVLVRQGGDWLFARRDYQLFMDEGV
jgi:ketosteroid isomerase-like protein